MNDLSQDTAYSEELIEMRQVLNDWLSSIEDWSELPENEMVKRFIPKGDKEQTPKPTIKMEGKYIRIDATQNASIGYQIDDGKWSLYTQPFKIPVGQSVKAKAIRYGWEESEVETY